ncbi:MAG: LysR family transcriptional regulator [Chloroflexi bacterium]|nr:LysR family transcriptional regulator [Chloroflexota bacterium]MCI0646104.1 LysR family transcriptional regulator [Chloroflexota bacterium]MCI0731570.1 LysR family transcriptional regulator [Chloroflexota bacterium]
MLDAHQMNVFLQAAKTLNFTQAARQLHMTQPSVSQHIQALEQYFNAPLFVRAGRHLTLTDAGAILMPLAQEMVLLSQQIEETMRSLKGEMYGHLQIGCSTTAGKYILPFLLASFMRQHSRVEANCLVAPRHEAVQMLCDGDVHLALASAQDFCKGVEFRKFISDPVVLIAPLDHPWAERREIDLRELLEGNFILREVESGTRQVAAAALEKVGLSLSMLHTVLTLGNSEAIALAVQEGIGVGFVSQIVVSRLAHGSVARVRVRGLSMNQDIFIGHYTGRPATQAQTAFWDFVTDPNNPVLEQLSAASVSGEWPSFQNAAINGRL